MEAQIDVVLVLLSEADKYGRLGRLVATTAGDDAEPPWTGEAMLHRDSRTGRIVLGSVVLACRAPPAIRAALRGALEQSWRAGGNVKIVGPDSRPLSGPEAIAALRTLCTPLERHISTSNRTH